MDNVETVGTMELGEAIEQILIESGLSISAFSRKIGYSRQYVYELLRKGDPTLSRKIQLDTLKKICDATGYSLRRLLGEIGYLPKRQPNFIPNSIVIVKRNGDRQEYRLEETSASLVEALIKSLAKMK